MQSTPYDESAVRHLLQTAVRADGHPPLSEHKVSSLGGSQSRVGVWSDEAGICVVCVAARHETDGHWAVEVAVAADRRGPRREEAAIRVMRDLVPGSDRHTLWAFRAAQIDAAERLGYRERRAVLRMTGAMPANVVPVHDEVTLHAMRPADAVGIVDVNNQAFRGHPEQGAMSRESLRSLTERGWFDPAGVVVARMDGEIVGFCITKREGPDIGEIFLVAVDPSRQGLGLGRALVGSGLQTLKRRDATTAQVWVDESNREAIDLYASFGLVEDFRTREMIPS